MTIELAIRLTEIIMGFAFAQQSLEHLRSSSDDRMIFIPRLLLSVLLVVGFYSVWVIGLLMILGLVMLNRYQGPYNGGADRMSLLILFCLCIASFSPDKNWQELTFGYLSVQLILSYFISGWVKLVNPQWRNGQALLDVFRFSAYPVSESLRGWVKYPRVLLFVSWAIISFELIFPLALLSSTSLMIALLIAACFHLSNAFIFGLNRFFWIWIAAYPSILWFQQRIFVTI